MRNCGGFDIDFCSGVCSKFLNFTSQRYKIQSLKSNAISDIKQIAAIHIPTNTKVVIYQIMEQTNNMGVSKSNEKTK